MITQLVTQYAVWDDDGVFIARAPIRTLQRMFKLYREGVERIEREAVEGVHGTRFVISRGAWTGTYWFHYDGVYPLGESNKAQA